MEELKAKKNLLLMTKAHIMHMPNTKKKAELISAYIHLLAYYGEVADKKDPSLCDKLIIDGEFTEKYSHLTLNDTWKKLTEFSDITIDLYKKYRMIIETAKENDYCSHAYYSSKKVDFYKMVNLVEDFFASLGEDVLSLYLEMANGNNILTTDKMEGMSGYAVNTIPIDNPCVVVKDIHNYFDFFSTLVHEVGHAYQFYLQRNQKDFSTFDPYVEINSHLFERLFWDYLKKHHEDKYCDLYEEEDYNYFLNEVSASKILCHLITNYRIAAIDPYSLEYSSYIPYEKLKEEMINDCGYIIFNKKNIELTEFNYSLGKSIAMYFHEKLKNNFEEEWKNYKNFLCTIKYLPMKEVFDKYFDVDLVNENVKRVTKSYHGR